MGWRAVVLVRALQAAGPNLTVDSFVNALETAKPYRSVFGGPEVAYGPKIRQGSKVVMLHQIKGGRFVMVDPNVKY